MKFRLTNKPDRTLRPPRKSWWTIEDNYDDWWIPVRPSASAIFNTNPCLEQPLPTSGIVTVPMEVYWE